MDKRKLAVMMMVVFVAAQCWGARVRPFVNIDMKTDDNIYLEAANPDADSITTISPGVNVLLKAGAHMFTLSGFMDMMTYGVNPSTNNASNTTIKIGVDSKLGSSGKFMLSNIGQTLSDPATSELTARTERTQTTTTFGLSSELITNLSISVDGNMVNHAYTDTAYANYDRIENKYGVTFAYALSKINLLLGYNTGGSDYTTDTNDNTLTQILVGIERKVTARLKTQLKVGTETRDYTSASITDPASITIASLQFSERLSPNTLLNVKGEMKPTESLSYPENPYFDSTALILGLEQKVGKKMMLNVGLTNRMNSYPNAIAGYADLRADTLMDITLNLTYKLPKYATLKLGYRNRSRESNFNTEDYANSIITVGADLAY